MVICCDLLCQALRINDRDNKDTQKIPDDILITVQYCSQGGKYQIGLTKSHITVVKLQILNTKKSCIAVVFNINDGSLNSKEA